MLVHCKLSIGSLLTIDLQTHKGCQIQQHNEFLSC